MKTQDQSTALIKFENLTDKLIHRLMRHDVDRVAVDGGAPDDPMLQEFTDCGIQVSHGFSVDEVARYEFVVGAPGVNRPDVSAVIANDGEAETFSMTIEAGQSPVSTPVTRRKPRDVVLYQSTDAITTV